MTLDEFFTKKPIGRYFMEVERHHWREIEGVFKYNQTAFMVTFRSQDIPKTMLVPADVGVPMVTRKEMVETMMIGKLRRLRGLFGLKVGVRLIWLAQRIPALRDFTLWWLTESPFRIIAKGKMSPEALAWGTQRALEIQWEYEHARKQTTEEKADCVEGK